MSVIERPICRGVHDFPKPIATHSCDLCGLDICESCVTEKNDHDLCRECAKEMAAK